MQQYLPELTPLIIGTAAFLIGMIFALRERSWRKAHGRPEVQRNAAAD
jgi:hypothetical protein